MIARALLLVPTLLASMTLGACARPADCQHPNRAVIVWSEGFKSYVGVFDPNGTPSSEVDIRFESLDAGRFMAYITLPGQLRQVCSGWERYRHLTIPTPIKTQGTQGFVIGYQGDAIVIYGVGEGGAGPDYLWQPKGLNLP